MLEDSAYVLKVLSAIDKQGLQPASVTKTDHRSDTDKVNGFVSYGILERSNRLGDVLKVVVNHETIGLIAIALEHYASSLEAPKTEAEYQNTLAIIESRLNKTVLFLGDTDFEPCWRSSGLWNEPEDDYYEYKYAAELSQGVAPIMHTILAPESVINLIRQKDLFSDCSIIAVPTMEVLLRLGSWTLSNLFGEHIPSQMKRYVPMTIPDWGGVLAKVMQKRQCKLAMHLTRCWQPDAHNFSPKNTMHVVASLNHQDAFGCNDLSKMVAYAIPQDDAQVLKWLDGVVEKFKRRPFLTVVRQGLLAVGSLNQSFIVYRVPSIFVDQWNKLTEETAEENFVKKIGFKQVYYPLTPVQFSRLMKSCPFVTVMSVWRQDKSVQYLSSKVLVSKNYYHAFESFVASENNARQQAKAVLSRYCLFRRDRRRYQQFCIRNQELLSRQSGISFCLNQAQLSLSHVLLNIDALSYQLQRLQQSSQQMSQDYDAVVREYDTLKEQIQQSWRLSR
ncbi:MAG: hypothetical protein VXY77_01490 [Pseudomonadota bacterium]|nr:hypothetical protein [Pseudomonadota bacterium]